VPKLLPSISLGLRHLLSRLFRASRTSTQPLKRASAGQIPKAKFIVDDCTGCEFWGWTSGPFDCIHIIEDPTPRARSTIKVGRGRGSRMRGCQALARSSVTKMPLSCRILAGPHRAAMLPSQVENISSCN